MNARTIHIETFHINAAHRETGAMLARLRRLPPRLRLAHLSALMRCEEKGSPRATELKRLLASMIGGRAE